MKRKILILLLLFFAITIKAQDKESIHFFTDRDLYVSGETLLLKVFAPVTEQSGIVNINLYNNRGKKITGIILEVINHQADGFIYLPDSLSSGSYLVQCSTRTDNILISKVLYVANRFKGLPESDSYSQPSDGLPVKENQIQHMQVDGIEKEYKPRVKGHATIHLPDELLSKIEGNLSISVSGVIPGFTSATFKHETPSKVSLLAVKEGIILEGKVTDLKTTQPFKNAVVYLSIPDSIPGFQYYITGEDGRFYFQLGKYYGKIPVVIQCYTTEKSRLLKISINNPDSLQIEMVKFETSPFPSGFRKSVEKNTDAVTFRKIFNQQEITIQPVPSIKKDLYPFYGVPSNIVDPQLFIDLPNFNEISKELLPGVKYRNYNRIPSLQVFNATRLFFFEEMPLLLLDGIPILDINVIKDMGSKDIDKIEICQSERFYGDLTFPGVVAIYTSKADYTRVPESDDLIKLNLDVIQPPATLNMPSIQLLEDPDLRQVLLWKPSLKPEPTIALDFQTSDVEGSYKLVIRGKTTDGSIFYKEQFFEVN
jgi:hypothetical protein